MKKIRTAAVVATAMLMLSAGLLAGCTGGTDDGSADSGSATTAGSAETTEATGEEGNTEAWDAAQTELADASLAAADDVAEITADNVQEQVETLLSEMEENLSTLEEEVYYDGVLDEDGEAAAVATWQAAMTLSLLGDESDEGLSAELSDAADTAMTLVNYAYQGLYEKFETRISDYESAASSIASASDSEWEELGELL